MPNPLQPLLGFGLIIAAAIMNLYSISVQNMLIYPTLKWVILWIKGMWTLHLNILN